MRARFNEEIKIATAKALANVLDGDFLTEDYVIPNVFNQKVVPQVSQAVMSAANRTGVARASKKME